MKTCYGSFSYRYHTEEILGVEYRIMDFLNFTKTECGCQCSNCEILVKNSEVFENQRGDFDVFFKCRSCGHVFTK